VRQAAAASLSHGKAAGYDYRAKKRQANKKMQMADNNMHGWSANFGSMLFSQAKGAGVGASAGGGGFPGQAAVPQASHELLIFKRQRKDVIVDVKYDTKLQIMQISLVRRQQSDRQHSLPQASSSTADALQEFDHAQQAAVPPDEDDEHGLAFSRSSNPATSTLRRARKGRVGQHLKIQPHERRLINEVTNYLTFYKSNQTNENDILHRPKGD